MRQTLKRILPAAVRTPASQAAGYARRLRVWASILFHIQGATCGDTLRLLQSAAAAPVTTSRNLGRWQDPVLLSDAVVRVRGAGAYYVRKQTDDLYHVLPSREPGIVETVNRLLRPGDVFVDAGANIGFYSVIAAARVAPGGRVVAIEMMPQTAAVLRKNLQLNGVANARVIESALSDRGGDRVTAHVPEGRFGMASIASARGHGAIGVETMTLDDALADIPSIRLMKLDLEGAEERALGGARRVLERTHAIVFEAWGEASGIIDDLRARGFSIHGLDRRNHLAIRP